MILLMKHMFSMRRVREGFALPTVLIASVIMLSILTTAISSIGSMTAAIDSQYYNQLAREAAESGMARASECLKQTVNYTPQWSDASPLMPNTNCDGSIIPGASQWLFNSGNTRTTFRIGSPVSGASNSLRIAASGTVNMVRASKQDAAWRTYSQSLTQDNRYQGRPKIAGGAGWKENGHIAAIATVDNQLYGIGSNDQGQLTDSKSPTAAVLPLRYSLPAGVTSVIKVKTSGQGASSVCILGNNSQLYCRGSGLNGNVTGQWTQFVLPGNQTVMDFWPDGYGLDTICVITNQKAGYCAGESREGSYGNGDISGTTNYPLNNPQRFQAPLPAGVGLRKIVPGTAQVCAISDQTDANGPANKLYCSGRNGFGQIGGASTASTATPIAWPIPGSRSVQDVSLSYHSMHDVPVIHVLMTDGTIWSTGNYAWGELSTTTTSGSTGTSQSPTPFTVTDAGWAAGSILWNQNANKCLDNYQGKAANNNKIQIWDCGGTNNGPQTWYYGASTNPYQITNFGTGMCLDIPNNNRAVNQLLQLYTCNGSPAQQFVLVGGLGGRYVQVKDTNLCLDIPGAATANGTAVQLYTCNSSAAQSFTRWGGMNGWKDMITGMDSFCGVRDDFWSGVWCAGKGTYGQLMNYVGSSSSTNIAGKCASTPYYDSVSGNTYGYLNVNMGYMSGSTYVADAIDADKLSDEWRQQFNSLMLIGKSGRVYGAGYNEFGKLGNGSLGDSTQGYRTCTTSIMQLPAGVTAMDMSVRDEYTSYVVGSDGRIYASGRNNMGQVGDGTTTDRTMPSEVKLPRVGTNY